MHKTIEDKDLLALAKGFQQGDLVVIAKATYALKVTLEQIERTPTRREYSRKSDLEVKHLKKLDIVRLRLRIALGKIAAGKKILQQGKPIPTTKGCILRSVKEDGRFLGVNPKTKEEILVDPLSEDFVEHLESQMAA
jgi:hypothetical protein